MLATRMSTLLTTHNYSVRKLHFNSKDMHIVMCLHLCITGDFDIGKGTYVPLWSKYYLYNIMLTTLRCAHIFCMLHHPQNKAYIT